MVTVLGAERGGNGFDNRSRAQIEGRLAFTGRDSTVRIGAGSRGKIYFEVGSNVSVAIGRDCFFNHLEIRALGENRVEIGARCSFNARVRLLLHEPGSITAGVDCLFGSDVDVTISDMHSIIDAATGKRLNPARSVAIDDHVWIGEGVLVLKGARIGKHSVIGARSVVTRDIPASTVATGQPARVVRTGVTWTHKLV